MSLSSPVSSAALSDLVVAELLEEMAGQLQAGSTIDVEAYVRAHPEHAERLRRLLPAVHVLAGLGQSAAGGSGATTTRHGPVPQVLGDFRIIREVGRGGMGVVYEAEQLSLGRRVALKVLPFAGVLDPRQLQRFQNEARAAASLHHHHIVPVFAVGCDREVHYYAMQFIEGRTLAALIGELRGADNLHAPPTGVGPQSPPRARPSPVPTTHVYPCPGPMPTSPGSTDCPAAATPGQLPAGADFFRRAALVGVQAALALEHAHQLGIVHRDIKPANLLLDASGNLWVTDFGLAYFQADAGMTLSGDLIGTLRYMSPEQALGQRGRVDHRTDVYSLGATLYELVTLQPAFDGADRADVIRRVVSEEPVAPRRLDRTIPADLETIIGKAMAKAPEERYATAGELAEDLRRFLDDRPILARRPTPWHKTRKWARRNRPLVWSLALFALLSLVGSLVGVSVYALKARKDREENALQLYEALLGRADSARLARKPGYREKVWDDLRAAAALDVPSRRPGKVREVALASLGDPLGMPEVPFPAVARVKRRAVPAAVLKLMSATITPDDAPHTLSQDGLYFAYRIQGKHVMYRSLDNSGYRAGESPVGAIYDLAFTPDGRALVAGCEEGVVIWGSEPIGVPLITRTFWSAGNITSVAVHPSGRLLATFGRKVELWSLGGNRLITSISPPDGMTRVEFSKDGSMLLAIAKDRAVRGWPIAETAEKLLLRHHHRGVPAIAFSPDGRIIASGSKDGTLKLWDAAAGRLLSSRVPRRWPKTGFVQADPVTVEAVAFSPDGKLLASADWYGALSLFDVDTDRQLALIDASHRVGQIWRIQFGPGGHYVVAGGARGVAAWSLRTEDGKLVPEPSFGERTPVEGTTVYDVAVHPTGDGVAFLTAEKDVGVLYAWRPERDRPRALSPVAHVLPRSLHFGSTGNNLYFVTASRTLGELDWKTGKAHDTGQKAFQIALGPDEWAATSTAAQEVVVFRPQAKDEEVLTLPPESGDVWALAWSPDGARLAVGLSDGDVAVWNLKEVRARLAELGVAVPGPGPPRD